MVNMTTKKDICVSFKRAKGNDIYFGYIVARIREEFLDCEVSY